MTNEPHRNPAWEDGFIAEAADGIDTRVYLDYLHGVQERLEKGRLEYGDGSYLEKHLPPEIAEEAFDGTAWGVLWAQQLRTHKYLNNGEVELLHAHIRDGIRHFILAYASMRAARELATGFERQPA